MRTIERTIKTFECEVCGQKFENRRDCEIHEKGCQVIPNCFYLTIARGKNGFTVLQGCLRKVTKRMYEAHTQPWYTGPVVDDDNCVLSWGKWMCITNDDDMEKSLDGLVEAARKTITNDIESLEKEVGKFRKKKGMAK